MGCFARVAGLGDWDSPIGGAAHEVDMRNYPTTHHNVHSGILI